MLTLKTCAKVNLFLHVGHVRDDGYHDLSSLAAFPDIGDHVSVTAGSDFSLNTTGPFAGALEDTPPTDNLVTRAAQLLADHLGRAPYATITLEKNLPPASGIGGGTGDAAATLVVLRDLWMGELPDADLMQLAFQLGADGPLCLSPLLHPFDHPGYSAVMTGAGEKVVYGPKLQQLYMCLINPGIAVPTGAVFAAFDEATPLTASAALPTLPASLTSDGLIDLLENTRNDLMDAAISRAPVIANVLADLDANPECRFARMSGSGATCFGLFDTAAIAENAAQTARTKGWWAASGSL